MRLEAVDKELPRLTLGTWAFAGGQVWGDQEEQASVATIGAALDRGITFFDTAPGYGDGESERILGRGLKGRRDEAIIATKVSTRKLGGKDAMSSCEQSLKRLGTDHIDLLQAHWPNHDIPFGETVAAFTRLKDQGKVRAIGVCNFGPQDMKEWLEAGGEIVTNQLPYSLISRSIEFEIIPECERRRIVILPYSPLMQGLLTGKFKTADSVPDSRARSRHFNSDRPMARHGEEGCEVEAFKAINRIGEIADRLGLPMEQVALAWLLARPTVASVIVGARNVEQIDRNSHSLDIHLSPKVVAELDEATDDLKRILGSNPDLWESPGRYR